MREEAIVVALGAETTDGHVLNASAASLGGDERAQVCLSGAAGRLAGELAEDVRSDLVTAAANRGTEMDAQLRGAKATMLEGLDAVLHDAGRCAAPAGMKKTDGASGVGDEDGNAVRNGHREHQTPVDGDVSVDSVDT